MTVDVQFNVDQALAKLGDLVAKHGPDAVSLAAGVVQVNGAGQLVAGVVFVVAAGGLAATAPRLFKYGSRLSAEYDKAYQAWRKDYSGEATYPNDASVFPFVAGVFSCGGAALSAVASAICLLDVWAWVALFNPKLALAHQVLAKFAGL